MFLKRITLSNFKCYEGTHTLNLSAPGARKNLVLIGGKNGAGKTSLLKAMTMCLYSSEGAFRHGVLRGPGFLSPSERKEELRNEIRSIINKSALLRGTLQAQVTLEFETPDGEVIVTRTWKFDRSGELVDEVLEIVRNGMPIQEDQDPVTGDLYTKDDAMAGVMET